MGSTVFRNPRALSSALAALGTLQPRALGFLNTVDPLDTVSNCYIEYYGFHSAMSLIALTSHHEWTLIIVSIIIIENILG